MSVHNATLLVAIKCQYTQTDAIVSPGILQEDSLELIEKPMSYEDWLKDLKGQFSYGDHKRLDSSAQLPWPQSRRIPLAPSLTSSVNW